MMLKTHTAFLVAMTLLTGGRICHGAILTQYNDRVEFENAAGPTVVEDFGDITERTFFHETPIDVGDFTIRAEVGEVQGIENNYIDPFYVRAWVDKGFEPGVDSRSMFIEFDSPITAFGAQFLDLSDQRTEIFLDDGTTIEPPVDFVDENVTYFGFTSDTPFTTLEFRHLEDGTRNAFLMRGVTYSFAELAAVPEPGYLSALAVIVPGLLGFTWLRRRRKGLAVT